MTIYLDKGTLIFARFASLLDYNGHKVDVEISDAKMYLQSFWDSGSKKEFYCFDMSGKHIPIIVQNAPLPFYDGPKADYIPSPDRFIIEHSTFGGKDMGLTVYLHPQSIMVKSLPATSKPDIQQNDLFILTTIKAYKSFARPDAYKRAGFTTTEVDKIKERLFQQGYINKAGAITPAGRNIVERSFDGLGYQQTFQHSFKKEIIIDISKEA